MKMIELNKMNVNVGEIKSMNFKHLKDGKGKFIIKINKEHYKIDINSAFDYFYLYNFLMSICSDSYFKDWLRKYENQYIKQQVNCVMAFIKFDRDEKTTNMEISHIELIKILRNDYGDFEFNALMDGNFNKNYKNAINIYRNRQVVYA